jgi:hypothetical protein
MNSRQFRVVLFSLLLLPFHGFSQNDDHVFFVKNYGGKCLDFGPPPQVTGAPVFLYECNGSVAQQIRVVEPDSSPTGRHKVILFAGTKVIGVRKEESLPGGGGAALELQDQSASSQVQLFQLDGDSIISGDKRDLVVQVQNSLSADRTPLVWGPRELKDSEFWDFTAVDGSSTPPTSGFVHVPQDGTLADALKNAVFGSVIVLDGSFDLEVPGMLPLVLQSGVTLRSDRRFTNWGARLRWGPDANFDPGLDATCNAPALLDACASYTRITGLRLGGPSCTEAVTVATWIGILADDAFPSIIDHNELSCWTVAAVGPSNVQTLYVDTSRSPLFRPQPVQVVRNFIHHNEMAGFGYGVAAGKDSFPLIQGNTFLMNRHAITGDTSANVGYLALHNLVLNPVPGYKGSVFTEREQDFDMHGSQHWGCGGIFGIGNIEWCGGRAGQYINIQGNTFLGTSLTATSHPSFFLRGTPTFKAIYQNNIIVQRSDVSIKSVSDPDKFIIRNNTFSATNPTNKLAVGDFDGDGVDDLFLATGSAWYYSPAGQVDWRFLNAHTETLGSLLFGDFDGDGRTDVFKQQGRDWLVSWGGISAWEKINESNAPFADLAVGDFDGDGRSDIFYSDGHSWFVSSGGTGPLTRFQTSSLRVRNLRFGDFNHDLKTDVFGIVSGSWQVSYGAKSSWTRLRAKLTDSVVGLMIADFDGDGKDDVAVRENGSLKVSSGGTGNWKTFSTSPFSITAFGRFQIQAKRIDRRKARADLLVWDGNYLDILPGGKQPTTRHNPEEMR